MASRNLAERGLVIYGGSYLNKGGTAITYGTLKVLKELGVSFKYIIDPEPLPDEHFSSLGLTPIYRYSDVLCDNPMPSVTLIHTFRPFAKCLLNSRIPAIKQLKGMPLWHIGDGCFSDQRSVLSLVGQVISLDMLRIVLKGKLIIGGISLAYPRTKIGEIILRRFFKSVDHFFIRGSKTYDTLTRLGVPDEKMSITCDFAFHLEGQESIDSEKCSEMIRQAGKPAIALVLRKFSQGRRAENYVKALRILISRLKEQKYKVFFVPTSYSYLLPENDLLFLREELGITDQSIVNIKDFRPEEIIHIFQSFDVVISSRLHGAVYSALGNVPVVHLFEAPKSLEVIQDMFGDVAAPLVDIGSFSENPSKIEEIIKTVEDLIQRKETVSTGMKKRIDAMRKSSMQEIKHVLKQSGVL
ncbi:MAG: polysaccharide pyruvyl transferase family protein [Chloroflexi bacterium]|nr:polysaccharide pyruvyl transferase family protein [Chloroflexota bacterium]